MIKTPLLVHGQSNKNMPTRLSLMTEKKVKVMADCVQPKGNLRYNLTSLIQKSKIIHNIYIHVINIELGRRLRNYLFLSLKDLCKRQQNYQF